MQNMLKTERWLFSRSCFSKAWKKPIPLSKVPELAGFWLLTVLLQFPLQGFLLFNEDLIILPMERAANILMVLMIIAELITGFVALRKVTRHQAKKFHLMQFQMREEHT